MFLRKLSIGLALGLAWSNCQAGGLFYSLQPNLLSSDYRVAESTGDKEARLSSGLGVAIENNLVAVSLDYKLQSSLKNEGMVNADMFSQQMGASLHSSALNQLLGMSAGIDADSSLAVGGDSYRYRIIPGISKSISNLADVSIKYEYVLDKASAEAAELEKKAFSMGVNGSLQGGRLTWQGDYVSSNVFEDGLAQTQSTEEMRFQSRYQLVSDLHLELSSAIKDETLFSGGLEDDVYTERRYGAGVAWSPSRHYSLAFRLNKLDETRYNQAEVFGSGRVSWFPQRNLEFSLSYGDQLIDGARGLMLKTRIALGES